jgi:hypothetical protein
MESHIESDAAVANTSRGVSIMCQDMKGAFPFQEGTDSQIEFPTALRRTIFAQRQGAGEQASEHPAFMEVIGG